MAIGKVFATTTYTDELPAEYLKRIQEQKIDDSQQFTTQIPDENAVKIHSSEKIKLSFNIIGVRNGNLTYKQNINLNDKVVFLASEDVYKKDTLFIRKNTPIIGLVRKAEAGISDLNEPSQIEVSQFFTRDINGNEVKLYGIVREEAKIGSFSQAAIKKNKEYSLYYK